MSGPWIGWNGGERPVHPTTVVEVITEEGKMQNFASGFIWEECENTIIAYRVIKEHREPREVWATLHPVIGWTMCRKTEYGATLFREVIE